MQGEDLRILAGAHAFFIRKGEVGSEPILIKALNIFGTKKTCTVFLNSGKNSLREAAEKWAKNHGYSIMRLPGSRGGPVWGRP